MIPSPRWRRLLGWIAFWLFAISMAVFWTWALFIAKPDRVNKIGDQEWIAWAESRCAASDERLNELADFTRVREPSPEMVERRAEIVDDTNAIVAEMLATLRERTPADEKGKVLIPAWLDRYDLYLSDREAYAEELHRTGEYSLFVETITEEGIPNSELLLTFANDNGMPSCGPKGDLN